jgi:PAS domain S-box-containing protein
MRDITASTEIARELQEREQQLQAAIELAKLGVWKLYLKSSEIECSARSKAHFGYPADAAITLEMIIDRILPEDRDLNLKEALDYKEEYHGEYRVLWPDGSLHWIALSGQGQYSKSGKPFAVVGVTLDITERKLEEQRKDSFIGMAGHELKTPLTSLKGFVQLLARQLKRLELPNQIAILNRMDNQIDTMTALVNELMDVSQLQAEKLEYTWKMVDIDRLLKKVCAAVQQTSNHHTIVVHGSIGTRIRGDQARLEQVFTHLLTNAVKYSPQATRVDVTPGIQGDYALIQIRDYGIGIPAEERERVFGRFYRADTAWSRAISGMGMGLYIARSIVEKHGGTISVASKVGEGSTFSVELPLNR